MAQNTVANRPEILINRYERLVEQLDNIAADPGTEKRLLKRLSTLTDEQIRTSVCLNRNTPSNVLIKFLKYHPGLGGTDEESRLHICYNPSLPLSSLKKLMLSDVSLVVRNAAKKALAKRDLQKKKRRG
jgi:hypothetical protein